MTGKQQLIIDASEWVRGMTSGPDTSDGGFSNETDQVNLIGNPGVLHHPAQAVDSDTDVRLGGNIIATSPDMVVSTPTNRLLISDEGKLYRYNGTKITAAGVSLTAGKTWTKGFTDIITFLGEAFVTSKESISRIDNSDVLDAGADFPFNFTNSNVPHPAIVYENNAYYGDKNLLLQQTAVGTAPATILTLSSDQVIISLGIDPATGLMLISTSNALDISATLTSINKLLWYDGNSLKVVKSIIVESAILGFHTVGGTVFAGYGKNLGYLSGSGIQFLRRLKNVTASNTELPYKHNFAHIGNHLYVVDGQQILAFGEVIRGNKVFYYCYSTNNVGNTKITALGEGGGDKLVFGFPTTKFYSLDVMSIASSNTTTMYTKKYNFPRPVFLRMVYIEWDTAVANNDDNRSIYYQGEDYNLAILRIMGNTTGAGLKNTTGGSVYFTDNIVGFSKNKVRFVQFRYIGNTINIGVRRIILYYDWAE